jgi:isopenicillin N synthase-like dioxygenase
MTKANVAIPIIDMSLPDDELIPLIADACSTFGFFQIIHVNQSLILAATALRKHAMMELFSLPQEEKLRYKRHQENSRGYFDDELTKQRRDWKECWDIGMPGSRDWTILPDDDPVNNACLDGFNVFPPSDDENSTASNVREIIVHYFQECTTLSQRLALLMARGLKITLPNTFLDELAQTHSSYLRLNHYPPCHTVMEEESSENVLGISPHRDAGFLTILLQDEDCHSLQVWYNEQWITIHPEPQSFTINTGDMCMLWSNGRYQAPLHRVLTHESFERYSAPFFYNPGYHQWIRCGIVEEEPKYHPCLFGYFRAIRFAGDLTDLGVEIQIQDYEVKDDESPHLQRQIIFAEKVDFRKPFSVEKYRPLLLNDLKDNFESSDSSS